MKEKSFIILSPCVNVVKRFFFVKDKKRKSKLVFVPGEPLQ